MTCVRMHPATLTPTLITHIVRVLFQSPQPHPIAHSCHAAITLVASREVASRWGWSFHPIACTAVRLKSTPLPVWEVGSLCGRRSWAGLQTPVPAVPGDRAVHPPYIPVLHMWPLGSLCAGPGRTGQPPVWHWAVCSGSTVPHSYTPAPAIHHQGHRCQQQEPPTMPGE